VPVLQIEHPVRDFETWKAAFDDGRERRQEGKVRRYEVYRPVDDPNYIAVDLEFDSRDEAEAFKLGLEEMWRSPQAARVLGGTPRARIVDVVESTAY
jgi:ribosomal protein L35AE/L33A